MEEKECPMCEEVKPVSEFGERVKPEGVRVNSWCRKCRGKRKIKSQIEREKSWVKLENGSKFALPQPVVPVNDRVPLMQAINDANRSPAEKFTDAVIELAEEMRPKVEELNKRVEAAGIKLKPRSMGLSTLCMALYGNDRDEVLKHYLAMYPNDKAGPHRSIRFMKAKLLKRLNRGK